MSWAGQKAPRSPTRIRQGVTRRQRIRTADPLIRRLAGNGRRSRSWAPSRTRQGPDFHARSRRRFDPTTAFPRSGFTRFTRLETTWPAALESSHPSLPLRTRLARFATAGEYQALLAEGRARCAGRAELPVSCAHAPEQHALFADTSDVLFVGGTAELRHDAGKGLTPSAPWPPGRNGGGSARCGAIVPNHALEACRLR
jgi:hypothetical protein